MYERSVVTGSQSLRVGGSLLCAFLAFGGCLWMLKRGKDLKQEVVHAQEELDMGGVFLRPSVLAPGSTYEVYLDAALGDFTENTLLESDSLDLTVLSVKRRHARGLTLQVAVEAGAREGPVRVAVRTPRLDGTFEVVRGEFVITRGETTGADILFENLPAGDSIVVEGGFAHFEIAIEGDGPFYLEYGLRNKSYWCGRDWNLLHRERAAVEAFVVESPEAGNFTLPLPERLNIVDVVAIDRNGRESFYSLVVGTRAPCDMKETKEAGLLDKIFGKKVAFAGTGCTTTNPDFALWTTTCTGQGSEPCIDTDGTRPLEFTDSTCQGTVCDSCCGGGTGSDAPLHVASVGTGGGGFEARPDGYAPPTAMMRERGGVLSHSGEYRYSVVDMSIPVPGLTFEIRRTYRSQIAYHSRFGRNWDSNIFARYLRYGTVTGTTASFDGDLYYYRGDGRRDRYEHLGAGSFDSPRGFYDEINYNSSANDVEFVKKDGRRWVFTENQVGDTAVYGKLSYIYGRKSGNYLRFQYNIDGELDKISSSTGIDLILEYSSGYLTWIYQAEDTSHEVKYYRDGSNGLLNKVEYSKTEFYDYNDQGALVEYSNTRKKLMYSYGLPSGDEKYNMEAVYDGRGNTAKEKDYRLLKISYDGSDRVAEFEANPNSVGSSWTESKLEFSYSTNQTTITVRGENSASSPTNGVLRKIVLTYDSDKHGVLTREIQNSSGTTIADWTYQRSCDCNRVTKITDPLGRVEYRTYDGYGNLTARRLAGDDATPTNYQDDIITLYKYEDPYYVTSSEHGGIEEIASPEAVASKIDDANDPIPAISTISSTKKTVYTYESDGDVEKIEFPEFKYASEFGDASSYVRSVHFAHNNLGQVRTETVKIGTDPVYKKEYQYWASGNEKSLIHKVIEDPGAGKLNLTTEYSYDESRDLTAVKDPRLNSTSIVRTGDRLIEKIQPPAPPGVTAADLETRFRYDANNNVVRKDVGGNQTGNRFLTYFVYDILNQLETREQDVDATTTVATDYEYDGIGRQRKIDEPGGKTTRIEYDLYSEGGTWYSRARTHISGTGISEVETGEALFEETVELFRERTSFNASEYASTWHVYDDYGREELTVTSPDTGDSSGYASSDVFYATLRTYDKDGNVLSVERGEKTNPTDPYDKSEYTYKWIEETDYDELDRPIESLTYANYERDGGETTKSGEVKSVVKHFFVQSGQVKRIERRVLDSENADTTYEYDGVLRVEKIKYPDGNNRLEYTYDKNGNIEETLSHEYDPLSDPPETIDFVVSQEFNVLNQLTRKTVEGDDNDGLTRDYQRTEFGYDFRGNVSTITEKYTTSGADIEHSLVYDGLDRLTTITYDSETGGLQIENKFVYKDSTRSWEFYDGKKDQSGYGQKTTYNFHPALDVVENIVYAAQGDDERDFGYDRAGRLVSLTYANHTTSDVSFAYDLLGRLTQRMIHRGGSNDEEQADFEYDFLGRLTSADTTIQDDIKSDVARTYNSLFLTEEDQKKFDTTSTFTINTTTGTGDGYDAGGRRTRITYHNNASLSATRTLNFSYDENDRLEAITEGTSNALASISYAGPEHRVRQAFLLKPGVSATKLKKTVTYDHLLRPTETHYTVGTTTSTLRKYTEGWGDGSSSTQPVFNRRTFQKSGGSSQITYGYDALARLDSSQVGTQTTTFDYDDANNLTDIGTSIDYTHNASNELDKEKTGGSTSITFTHDNRGNVKKKDRTSGVDQDFRYDYLNRLVEYKEGTDTWHYFYDGLGRRVLKENTDESHYYFYDGESVVLELVETTSGTEVKEYVYGVGLDEVLVEFLPDSGQKPFWPLVDSLGTVRDLADLDDSSVARVRMDYTYDAWGNVTSESTVAESKIEQDVLFTGRWLDREMINNNSDGLYHYRAREYDPDIGRFLQRDPIGIWEDRANIGNGYAYVGNNPLNETDPLGTSSGEDESCEPSATLYFYSYPPLTCCGPDPLGQPRLPNNCIYITIYDNTRGRGHGHASVGESPYPSQQYGFYKPGWRREPQSAARSVKSVWECCCLSNSEMQRFRNRIARIRALIASGSRNGLAGDEYSILGQDTCASEAARAAEGLGCPNLRVNSIKPFKLEAQLRANRYCRLKAEHVTPDAEAEVPGQGLAA